MKIGIITNLYPPYTRGGAENVVVRTVEQLLETGHDVFVITTHPKKGGRAFLRDRQTTERVYRFFPKNIYFLLNDRYYPWIVRLFWHIIDAFSGHGMRVVREILEDEAPDIVITHNLKGIGLKIPKAIQEAGIPHVHVVHDLQLIYPSGLLFAGKENLPLYSRPFYRAYQRICQNRMGKPDLVIFPSNYLKNTYTEHGFFKEQEILVMHNPAPKFQAERRATRPPGPLRLMFVGQLEEHKGIRFLLDNLNKTGVELDLIVAGEGSLEEMVKRKSAEDDQVVYLGYISLEQIINCFGIVDALIVPSLCYENSPTVIYESLIAGLPVIASNIGGVGELLRDGENGILFAPGSEQEFADAIQRLNAEKESFFARQEEIRQTVVLHALPRYTAYLIRTLRKVTEGTRIS